MFMRKTMRVLGLVALVASGCSGVGTDAVQSVDQNGKNCPSRGCTGADEPNGMGWYGYALGHFEMQFKFERRFITNAINYPDGVKLNVWHEIFDNATGAIIGMEPVESGYLTGRDKFGASFTVVSFTTLGTVPRLELKNSASIVSVLEGKDLDGFVLHFSLTPIAGRTTHQIELTFQKFLDLGAPTKDVFGLTLSYINLTENPGGMPRPICKRPDGTYSPNVFASGSYWHPWTGDRTDGGEYTVMTCEGGAIPVCMMWGYRPFADAFNASTGMTEKLRDTHQACIHMKRAAYCGNRDSYTVDGTHILISDVYDPQFNKSYNPATVEAIWSPKGALCVSNQRHPASGFSSSCGGAPMPTCDDKYPGVLTNSLP